VKRKLTYLLTATLLVSSSLALAAETTKSAAAKDQKPTVTKQTKSQDKQLAALSDQARALEKQLATLQTRLSNLQHGKKKGTAPLSAETNKIAQELHNNDQAQMDKILAATRYGHGFAVLASPFIGQRNAYNSGDLIVNVSSMNTDLRLLEQRQKLANYAAENGEVLPDYPVIDLSGSIEAKATYNSNLTKTGSGDLDFNLSRAELDAVAEVGQWATGAMFINYEDNNPVPTAIKTPNSRVTNSRLKIDRAFLTIGNINKFPAYFTAGQMFVPFGTYTYLYVSDPMTKVLGRVKTRAAEVGFSKWGMYASTYVFRGDSYVDNGTTLDNWGLNLGYKVTPLQSLTTDLGVSYIANMSDSNGLQDSIFGLKDGTVGYEKLKHRVPGADVHLTVNFNPFTFISEYVSALRKYDTTDMTFNGTGAKPSALDIEGVYNFKVFDMDSNFALGYDKSWQAMSLSIPQQAYFAVVNTSPWKFTAVGFEYRRNLWYKYSDSASTHGGASTSSMSGLNRTSNEYRFRIGIYF